MGDSTEAIRQLAKDFFEQIWNQGDESAIDRFISVNTVGNDPQFGTGRESFRTKWREWQNAFPDINFRIDDVIVEGNQRNTASMSRPKTRPTQAHAASIRFGISTCALICVPTSHPPPTVVTSDS